MPVTSGVLRLRTAGDGEIADLTAGVAGVVAQAGAAQAVATVWVTGSTAAVTTMEFEPGGVEDLRTVLEKLLPAGPAWAHNRLNGDDNAHAHLRASIIGPSVSVPVVDGRLALGTWQQIVLLDFDTRPRERTVTVQVAV